MSVTLTFTCPRCGQPLATKPSSTTGNLTRDAHTHLEIQAGAMECVNRHRVRHDAITITLYTADVVAEPVTRR